MSNGRSGMAAAQAAAAGLLGLFGLANGAAMLFAPVRWYWSVPGVPLTGGYNAHFIRDIGIVYLLTGLAAWAGLLRRRDRPLLWGAAAAWLGLHAVFHLVEIAAGICGPEAFPRDFVGVTLPALVALALALSAFAGLRRKRRGRVSELLYRGCVNGAPGFITLEPDGLPQVTSIEAANGRIRAVYVVRNPEKLRLLPLSRIPSVSSA